MPTVCSYYDVFLCQPGDPTYDMFRKEFTNVAGNPPLTGISLPIPRKKVISQSSYIVARYCLEEMLAGQTCLMTNFQAIDVELFFERGTISGKEQLHLLAHLVLASLDGLTPDRDVHDRVFADQNGAVLWFTAEFPPDLFRTLVASLISDLQALLVGKIQGRIARAVFD